MLSKEVKKFMAEGYYEIPAILLGWDSVDQGSLSLEQLQSILKNLKRVSYGDSKDSEIRKFAEKRIKEIQAE